MNRIKLFTVDAFTDKMFKGNPAGVVILEEKIDDEKMQLIAKELNLSETAFLLPSKNPNSDFNIRYFTPTNEIDFCGHATIAVSWILGMEYDYINKVKQLKLQTNIGVVPIDWDIINDKLNAVVMKQVEPKMKAYDEEIEEVLKYLNLSYDDIDIRYKIKYAYTGNWHLLIPVKTRDIIMSCHPDFSKLKDHNKLRSISTTHLFTFDTKDNNDLLLTRDFAPAVGVDEDPVTGSANGALAGYLVLEKIVDENNQFYIKQVNSLNRYGQLMIRTEVVDKKVKVYVGGKAVIVIKGEISLNI